MDDLRNHIDNYLEYCRTQKRLDQKTIKAYNIDLRQFFQHINIIETTELTSTILESYVANLHQKYAPKTAKRKIATLKAFFHYLEYKEIIKLNPLNKLQLRFREPNTLPKTIPLHTIEKLFSTMYNEYSIAHTSYQKKTHTLRYCSFRNIILYRYENF